MKKPAKRPLALSSETIRSLDADTLERAAGAATGLSQVLQSCDKKCSIPAVE
jgi:hypothetical protein